MKSNTLPITIEGTKNPQPIKILKKEGLLNVKVQ